MPVRPPEKGAPRRARDPLAGLRRLLLVLGILAVAGLAVLFAAYRFGRPADPGDPSTAEASDDQSVGRDFDYTQTSDGVPVFRIRAEKSRRSRDDTAFLERVILDIFREDGQVYTVTSDSATWSEGSWQAELEGDVVLRGVGDLVLYSRALGLAQEGQRLESRGEVRFEWGEDYVGRASELTVDRNSDAIVLGGGVHLRDAKDEAFGLRLDSRRVVYERTAGVLRAIGESRVVRGDELVAARQITVFLVEGTQEIRSIRASWDVEGALLAAWTGGATRIDPDTTDEVRSPFDGGTEIRFSGQHLEIDVLDPAAPENEIPRRLQLEGDGSTAELRFLEQGGLEQVIRASRLDAALRGPEILSVDAVGVPLMLTERVAHAPQTILQQACAETGRAFFLPDGTLGRIELHEQVELREPRRTVTGAQHAVLASADGRLEVEGPAVEVHDGRGVVTAPKFSWTRDGDLLRADGGVQATLVDRSLTDLTTGLLGRSRGPVRIVSRSALWTAAPPTFSFRGDVRAWRAESLLLAEQLRGEQGTGEVAASGGVKTVWTPPPGQDVEAVPIEVVAEQMTYRRDASEVVYDGGTVTAQQGTRLLSCLELTLRLDSAGDLDRMLCRDEVQVRDPAAGRSVEGDIAVYTLSDGTIQVRGAPVVLVDGDGNRLQGRYLKYDVRANRVQLSSEVPEDES